MTTVSTEVANACINQALAHTSAHDAERIATLEDLLRGREFAAAEHLETVKQQDKIIASLQAEIAMARNDALERAAAVCDSLGGDVDTNNVDNVKLCANSLAHAIRALKQTAPAGRPRDTGDELSIAPKRASGLYADESEHFIELMSEWRHADIGEAAKCAFDAVINHIDAALAQSRAAIPVGGARYTCKGKGGEYELIGRASAAGVLHDVLVSNDYPVYRDTESGLLFVRVGPDFDERMERITAPTAAKVSA